MTLPFTGERIFFGANNDPLFFSKYLFPSPIMLHDILLALGGHPGDLIQLSESSSQAIPPNLTYQLVDSALPHLHPTIESQQIYSIVQIKNTKNGAAFTYTIVSEEEADLKAGKISLASPSTIKIYSSEPATINSNEATSNCAGVGLIINFPSIFPTLTSDIGPLNGISETANAAEAANPAKQSGRTSESADIKVIPIWVSA